MFCTNMFRIGYGTGTALLKSMNFDNIDQSTVDAIKAAISLGYHHLDSADLYNTETELGIANQESNVRHKNLFITTKVNFSSFAYRICLECTGLVLSDLIMGHSLHLAWQVQLMEGCMP